MSWKDEVRAELVKRHPEWAGRIAFFKHSVTLRCNRGARDGVTTMYWNISDIEPQELISNILSEWEEILCSTS